MPRKRHSDLGRQSRKTRSTERSHSLLRRPLSDDELQREEMGEHLEPEPPQPRTPRRRPLKIRWMKAAFQYDPTMNYRLTPQVRIGQMTKICPHCRAKKWPGEPPGMCCSNGKVKLEALREPPQTMRKLLLEDTEDGKHFRQNTWKYNMAFTMTSFGADRDLTQRGFFTTFKIQGQCYHLLGSLLPPPNEEARYLQVYFLNGEEQAQQRCRLNEGTREDLIQELQSILHNTHPYVASFKYALEHMEEQEHKIVIHADKKPPTEHARRFNAPNSQEVAILMVAEEHGPRDVILRQIDDKLISIRDTHRYAFIQRTVFYA